ncbi:MAG: RHS repeat-associated core domain-containing protein [Candidatus Magasanikbacteria bacterium]
MFRNFKTIRLAISIIVIFQFGFLMPLAPVLAQEAIDLSVETGDVIIESIQLDTESVEPSILIDNVTLVENQVNYSDDQSSEITLTLPPVETVDNEPVSVSVGEDQSTTSETIGVGDLLSNPFINIINVDDSSDAEDVEVLNLNLDSNSDDVLISDITLIGEGGDSEENNPAIIQNNNDFSVTSTDSLSSSEQLDINQVNIILDNKQAADEVFENLLIFDEPEQEEIMIDNTLFEVVDELTDRGELPDGGIIERHYLSPRELYTDESGIKRVRPEGWHKFYDDERSRLVQTEGNGYDFSIPVSEDYSVEILSGDVEIVKGDEVISNFIPQEARFEQHREDLEDTSRVVTQYKGIYPNIDINFIDKRDKRTKEIIINEKMNLGDGENLLFWEIYKLPKDSAVLVGGEEYTKNIQTKSAVEVKMSNGKKFIVTPSVIFDSLYTNEEYREMSAQGIEHMVVFDKDKSELRIGLIAQGSYLNDEKRVYPIVIDPTYYTCDTGTCEGDIYLYWLTGVSAWYSPNLIMGYDYANGVGNCSPGGDASRHTVLKFNFAGATLNKDVESATVFLKRDPTKTGCGEYNSNISFRPKKITKSWALASNITYNYVRSTLQSGGNTKNLSQSNLYTDYGFVLDNTMVKNWINGVGGNYGVLIEPTDNFPSGTTVPTSWSSKQRLFWFYSSNYNSSYDPYLQVTYVTAVYTPDLTINSKSLSKTSVLQGESITAYVKVKNSGNGSAGSSYVGYYYSNDSNCTTGDTYLAQDSTESLSAGQISAQDSATITIPSSATPGTRYICFISDYYGNITESNENNNTGYVQITVSAPILDPDLQIYDKSLSSNTVEQGGQISAYTRVKNYGSGSAGSSYVGYYYSTDSSCSTSDSYLDQDSTEALSAGQVSAQDSATITIPSNATPGTRYICFIADRNGSVTESNESNNTSYLSITINASNQPPNTCSLTSPSNGSPNQNTSLTLDWSCSDPDGSIVNYYLQIDNNSNFSSPFYANWLGNANSNFGVSNLSYSTTYYWRVKAKDDDNAEGAYNSPAWYFTTKNQPAPGGGSSCDFNCDPNNNNDGDTQVETEEANEGLSDNIPNISPVSEASKKENSNKNDDKGADPVNLRTGSFELTQTDLVLQGRGENVDFTRYYNSKTEKNARFGVGWKYSYNQYYFKDPTTNKVVVYKGGNVANIFEYDGSKYISPGETDKLYPDAGGTYLILEKFSGTKYYYSTKLTDNMGLLKKISDSNGNETQFDYTLRRAVDMLAQVVDSSGRSITFEYGDILDDKKWDKITKLTYSTGDPNTKTTVDYIYEELSGGVVALKEVKRTRLYDGQSEIQTDKFTYAKYGTSDVYRLATQEDARGTILYNTYDSEGRTTVQEEYNPNVDEVGTSRLVWTLDYLGEDPSVVGDDYCTLVKNYSDEVNYTDQKFCYNADHLKVYENNNGNKITYTRDANGMVTNIIRDNGVEGQTEIQYQYDSQKRVTKEILPDTDFYHTETWYAYGAFNRVEHKYIYVWDLGEDYTALNANATKHTSYNINPLNGNILSITYPDNITESFTYDSYGNVLTHTDKNGNLTTYIYDAGGNYVLSETEQVILPDGSNQTITKTYEYDEYGNRIKYTSPRNFEFTYEYDTKGNLRQETNPLGGSRTYDYDIENHRTDMYDELNRRTEYIYQTDISASLLQEKKYSLNGTKIISISNDYDNLGRVKTTYDANGNVTNFVYDGDGRIFKKIETFKTTEFSYYANGNLQFEFVYVTGQSSTNWLNKTGYFYDERNNLVETRQYKVGGSYIFTINEYDGFDRLVKSIDASGNETIYTYDLNDRLTTTVDSAGNTTAYNYDDNGNKTGEKLPSCFADQSKCNSLGFSNSYFYDGADRLIKVTNADNKETIYYYNKDGQVTNIIDRQSSGGLNNNHFIGFSYDALGRKTQECDAYNKCVGYDYDAVGNLTKVTDQIARETIYNYDDFNRLIEEIDPAGNITSYIYDDNGNKKSITYPDFKTTNYVYDEANRLKEVKDHLNNTRTYTYDAVGNHITEKDKRNFTTTFTYDKLNRLVSETNPQNSITSYTYDNNNNRLTEDVAGKVRTYAYDDLNRLTQISHLGNKTESYTYDVEGNVLTKTDGNNQTINYTYDNLNRLTLKELPEGDSVVYTYDNWDNLLSITDDTGITNYTYDNNNQQLQEQKTLSDLEQTYTIARTYYADGQLKTLTDASGVVITYEYNNRGLLSNVKNDTQTLASYTYTAQGLPEVLNYDNGTETNYTYDDLHRLSILEITNASSTSLFKHEYNYDAESNRTQLVENDTNIVNYTYDNLEQLTGATYLDDKGNQNISITYDIWGNRTLLNTTLGSTNYNYAQNSNELTAYSQNGRLNTSLTYDDNGSLTQESYSRLGKDIRTVNYSWDSQNRLKQIDYAYLGRPAYLPTLPNNIMQFAYDDFGNRIKKTVNNESTYYLNNGLTVLNEIAETGTIDKSIVQGLGQIAEIDKDGNIQFIHSDVLGSTVLITDGQGEVVAEYEYDAFGSVVGKSGLAESSYLFTNQEFDNESELYYYNARYYNPTLGRFISRDPMLGRDGDVLSKNSYIYVKNNPLKYVDPTGEEEDDVCAEDSKMYALFVNEMNTQGSLQVASFIDKLESFSNIFLDVGTMLTPVASDLRDLYEIEYQKDMISGRQLSQTEITLTEAGATVVILSGRELRFARNAAGSIDNGGRSILRATRRMRGVGAYRMVSGMTEDLSGEFYRLQKMTDGKIRYLNNGSRMTPPREVNYILKDGQIKFGDKHSFLAKGGNVDYAGSVRFSTDYKSVEWWNNGSGHYLPDSNDLNGRSMVEREFKKNLGIDLNNFRAVN